MARVKKLKDISGDVIYPKTVASAVVYDEGRSASKLMSNSLYLGEEDVPMEEINPIDADTLQGHDSSYFASKDNLNTAVTELDNKINALSVSVGGGIVYITETFESSASGGENVVAFSDGKTLTVKNGKDGSNYILTKNDEDRIVSRVFDLIKNNGVVGFVDENNNIVLNGTLTSNAYSIKYRMDDGSTVDIGNLVFDNNVYYTITNNLTNCTTNNNSGNVVEGQSYSAIITANDGYTLSSVVVTMGGTDITSTAVSGNNINIASVTGNVVISVTSIEVAPTSYTNILRSGTYDVELDKRWSASSKAYTDCSGMISVKLPLDDVWNKTIYIKGFENGLKANNSAPNWYALKSDDTKVTQLKGYTGSSGSGNVWECVSLQTLDNGVYGVPINSTTITTQTDVAYLMINLAAYSLTAIGTTIPNTFIITIDEEIN